MTAEGRVLTEVKLTLRNHAQPFLRVARCLKSAVLSAEVEGRGVKPAMGEGGTRILSARGLPTNRAPFGHLHLSAVRGRVHETG